MASRQREAGFSILEVLVAASILAFSITSIYVAHLTMLRQIGMVSQSSVINDHLMQRMEEIRATTWDNVTDPAYLSTVLSTPITSTVENVPEITEEKFSVSAASIPYMPPVPSTLPSASPTPSPFTVTKTGASAPVVAASTSGGTMLKQYAVSVTATAAWRDTSGRTHTREISTILSRAGMAH